MRIGVVIPQGWTGEYAGWRPDRAWARTRALAQQADGLGFESIWLFDHFQTTPVSDDELTFESFTALTALSEATRRVRLGHLVTCAGYRNPALVAKMIATMDVVSGGRMVLGVGAGWKEDEWRAYGYGFPPLGERLAALADHLEVVTRMLGPGHATFEGPRAQVADAINLPKGLQVPRVPIMVGGNGPKVTWRLAARFADELNIDDISPEEVAAALPVVRQRCEEIGRDPESLRISVHLWWERGDEPGAARVDQLASLRALGIERVMVFTRSAAASDESLARLRDDAVAAGAELEPITSS